MTAGKPLRHDLPLTQINITNLVDIALTLVVILLMLAPMIEQGIEVNLPVSAPARIAVDRSIILTVAPGQTYYMGSRRLTLDEIRNRLQAERERSSDISVIIKGDMQVPYGDLVTVLDTVRRCNIRAVGLVTRPE